MSARVSADVLVSSGRGTGTTIGKVVIRGGQGADHAQYRRVHVMAHEMAAAQSRGERGIATINLVNWWVDGVRVRIRPRVVAIYGNGDALVYGLDGLSREIEEELLDREERDRAAHAAKKKEILEDIKSRTHLPKGDTE